MFKMCKNFLTYILKLTFKMMPSKLPITHWHSTGVNKVLRICHGVTHGTEQHFKPILDLQKVSHTKRNQLICFIKNFLQYHGRWHCLFVFVQYSIFLSITGRIYPMKNHNPYFYTRYHYKYDYSIKNDDRAASNEEFHLVEKLSFLYKFLALVIQLRQQHNHLQQ